MRIVKMNPEKEWRGVILVQPGHGAVQHVVPATLQAVIVVLARTAAMKSGVVDVEAALKARSQLCGIQNQCTYEGCGGVSVLVKNVGQKREPRTEGISQIAD